jgi:hypothetical protein
VTTKAAIGPKAKKLGARRWSADQGQSGRVPRDLRPPVVTQFGPIEIEKALNLDGTEGLRRAPRPMKMGTTALPWRYDAAARRCDPAG